MPGLAISASRWNSRTCQDESNETEEKVEQPEHDTRKDDMSNERLDPFHCDQLWLFSLYESNLQYNHD